MICAKKTLFARVIWCLTDDLMAPRSRLIVQNAVNRLVRKVYFCDIQGNMLLIERKRSWLNKVRYFPLDHLIFSKTASQNINYAKLVWSSMNLMVKNAFLFSMYSLDQKKTIWRKCD